MCVDSAFKLFDILVRELLQSYKAQWYFHVVIVVGFTVIIVVAVGGGGGVIKTTSYSQVCQR
jgi:hypothetical protein